MILALGQKLNKKLCSLRSFKDKLFFRFAHWIPDNISPNQITAFRLAVVLAWLPFAFFSPHWTQVFIFLLVFLLDLLDGAVARLKNRETYLGTKLDPFSDRLNHITLYIVVYQLLPQPLKILYFFVACESFFVIFLIVEYFSRRESLLYSRLSLQFIIKIILWLALLLEIYLVY